MPDEPVAFNPRGFHMPKMSPVFLPTVELTNEMITSILHGWVVLRRGQWVRKNDCLGQYIHHRNGVLYVSWVAQHRNERFAERTQRFARAVWHHVRKDVSPELAVNGAPSSLSFKVLREWFRRRYPVVRRKALAK